ncbi:helix-turn-helix transcriptional regulator [Bacillus cereus group sp. BfR-BA-01119]|uniref:helix-turn-helix transcriptional regulator n=1 Tax=Bacillus cereus group TaxID=86661 RepID=UPI00103A4656|nr:MULTISPECIES: helix-turn-helix transcriptional regulator [Bacillus cereus group]MBJ8063569.1 helix-turn-helix transcriptional regulator [Bacillus cereus group sp. N15]MDX5866167.1 helix-turn-helix transcriptional regulator [Bacillus cereus group sp. BfR-BA-01119]MDX5907893.1 helix-turn-helix transcriptional regulator [Bacillus cereus group sp. BfR-BA-01029]TBX50029.1 XRE family transcriptional regulator [Bacillus toyonensis]HDR7446062.1 helix-turn-helix transcriptional regulator [Bacillus t
MNKITNVRKEKGITQEGLALKVGITRAYLSNLENGKHKPSLDVALKIAEILESTVEKIFK